jgi:ribonuclease P/MRP protein subunit RPP40
MVGAAIKKHHPQVIRSGPQQTRLDRILAPPLSGSLSTHMSEPDLQEACGSLAEWIAMVQLGSPRISADDDIDSFLCRYTVPEADQGCTTDLISLKWHGLISAKWIMHLFVTFL